jgi:hypothetical protein
VRDELDYKLASRGVCGLGEVRLLRKTFHAVQAGGVTSQASNLPQGKVDEMYNIVHVGLHNV